MNNFEFKKERNIEFQKDRHIPFGYDGWLAPDGTFFASNSLSEQSLHDRCATYILQEYREEVIKRLGILGKSITDEDLRLSPARSILGFATYLLISHGMPQYAYIEGELTAMQIGSLVQAGLVLPEEVTKTLENKLPKKEQIIGDLDLISLPEAIKEELLKKIAQFYQIPGKGILLSNIGNFVDNGQTIYIRFDYKDVAQKLFALLTKNAVGEIVSFAIGRHFGGEIVVCYRELASGLIVVLEKKSHSLNERLEFGLVNFVIEDFWIYIQTKEWVDRRYEKQMSRSS